LYFKETIKNEVAKLKMNSEFDDIYEDDELDREIEGMELDDADLE
jgi:hypothetical protein